MAIEIKELIVKGKINGSGSIEEKDIIEIINNLKESESNGESSLSESERRSLVDECVQDVITKLDTKNNF